MQMLTSQVIIVSCEQLAPELLTRWNQNYPPPFSTEGVRTPHASLGNPFASGFGCSPWQVSHAPQNKHLPDFEPHSPVCLWGSGLGHAGR